MPKNLKNQVKTVTIQQYRINKRILKNLEANNHDQIIVMPCDGEKGWCDIAENSALIYYYEVRMKLNGKNKFFADNKSYYDQYEIGYMRTKGVDSVRKSLKELNLLESEFVKDEFFHIFQLKHKFSTEHLNKLRKREFRRRLENSSPVETSHLDPELWQNLATASTRLHQLCTHRLDHLSSNTNGARIIALIDSMLGDYHRLVTIPEKNIAKARAILKTMAETVENLIIEIKILGDANLWAPELCNKSFEPLLVAQERIKILEKGAKK